MAEVVKKQFKSKYHILIWIAVLSLIFMGMVEYGYVTGGRPFGNWKACINIHCNKTKMVYQTIQSKRNV